MSLSSKNSLEFVDNFLSYPVDRQTDRQTDKGKNITSLADVSMYAHQLKVRIIGVGG